MATTQPSASSGLPIAAITPPPPPPPPAAGVSLAHQMRGIQIGNVIEQQLQLNIGSFSLWRHMMELFVDSYDSPDHLTVDTPLAERTAEWRTIDLIIKRWIYAAVSLELRGMITDHSNTKTARQVYVSLIAIFLNNKRTRAVHLTGDLHDQRKGNLGVAQFCARIKTIADALNDIDQPVNDDVLITVLTRGLHERHHMTAKIIQAGHGKISFDDARNMLLKKTRTLSLATCHNP